MKKLNENDFANLEPRSQPYEVRAEIDLALRIFPNGSKTWVYIYFDQKTLQRKTLGIYPEMRMEQAYLALDAARYSTSKTEETVAPKEINNTQGRGLRYAGGFATIALTLFATSLFIEETSSVEKSLISSVMQIPALTTIKTITESQPATPPPIKAVEKVDISAAPPAVNPPILVAAIEPEVSTTIEQTVEVSEVIPPSPVEPLSSDVAAQSNGLVKRAQFTSGIQDREPVDQIERLLTNPSDSETTQQLYFFTEVAKLEGHIIYHRWQLDGEVMAEIPFEVGSNWRWRVFSSKKILSSMRGEWQVSVVDDLGNVLHSETFSVQSTDDEVKIAESEIEAVALLQ
ncbi:MAG: DUF2914 domain-containing protein [Candidatus Polarisedimenticolaceae bacterium]|nr:DUF2914 domain-containing protein [Candidatus Polarisedimenticolaceae bacterium]